MDNILIVVSIVLIIGLAGFYVYKSKKSGSNCIGCPDGCSCGRHGDGCHHDEDK